MATKKAAKKAPKKAAKKAPARKKVAKKAAPVKKSGAPIQQKMPKGQIVTSLAESSGLTKKQISAVLDEYDSLIERSIKKRSVGEFTIPGIMKIYTVNQPARKASVRPDPFNPGQMMNVKAKPASIRVKIRPLKKLKEFAQ
jgi:nucleoid DNA-binding protein